MKSINKTNHDSDSDSQALKLEKFCDDMLTIIAGCLSFSDQLTLRVLSRSFHENQILRLILLDSVIRKFTITEIKTSYHTHVKMQSGHWYSWGSNRSGELGFTTESDCLSTPRRNKTLEQLNPEQHAIGRYHHVATKKNKLYSWGSNSSGQLGNGTCDHHTHHHPTPLALPSNPAVIKTSSNGNYNIIQASSGIFSFGSNPLGQLGHGDQSTERVGRILAFITPVTVRLIACGQIHVMLQTREQKVFAWGCNSHGELGVGRERIRFSCNRPIEIEMLNGRSIKQMAAANHSCALMQNGTVYIWGGNQTGELGFGNNEDVYVPTPLPLPFEVDTVHLANRRSFYVEKSPSNQLQTVLHQKKRYHF